MGLRVGVFGLLFWASSVAGAPLAFRVSSPTQPGDTALVYGDGLDSADTIRVVRLSDDPVGLPPGSPNPGLPGEGLSSTPVQQSKESLKFALPAGLEPGVFAAWAHAATGWTKALVMNRADPWWVQGDRGRSATPGGWLRVLGINLDSAAGRRGAPRMALTRESDSRTVLVEVDTSSPYSLRARIPETLPDGEYQVWVHNGFGGRSGWATAISLRIARSRPWPQRVIDVKQLGASGMGSADDSAAVARALDIARQDGGGIVFFPRGLYRLEKTLQVPPKTVLRGERQDLVDLFWHSEGASMLPAVIRGTHSFALEDLTLHFAGAEHGIVADAGDADAGDVALRRIRVRWLLYSGLLDAAEVHRRFSEALKHSMGGGDLVRLDGQDIEIVDCDLYSAGRVLALQNVIGARISGNVLYNGRRGWYNVDGGERIIFENNEVIGGDLMSTGGGISTYRFPSSRWIYFGENRFRDLYGWEREAITTDGGGGDTIGPIARATATSVEYPSSLGWQKGSLTERVAYVLAGKGKGQYRRVTGNDDRSLSTAPAWDVVPDSTSVVGVTWMRGGYLFVRNTVTDAGIAVQLYGVAFDSIVAENRSIRAGGFRSFAKRYLGNYGVPTTRGIQPQMFVQFLDNEIVEGSSYHMGTNQGSFLELVAAPPTSEWSWPMAFGFVFRGNRLDSWSRLRLSTAGTGAPLIEDVIIERNRAKDSPIAVEITPRTQRVLLNANRFENGRSHP